MELAPGDEPKAWCTLHHDVSILVFVELAPGVLDENDDHKRRLSFNPCFCGTRPRRPRETATWVGLKSVSILVFVELAPGV